MLNENDHETKISNMQTINYKEDVKRKILNTILRFKNKNIPEEIFFGNIRSILKRYNLDTSDKSVLNIYKECEAYISINNLFNAYQNKSFKGLDKKEAESIIQYAQVYLSKKKYSDVSRSEAKKIMFERNIAEELAKKYLYNPDGTNKVDDSLIEDKLFTIYLRTGQFDILEEKCKKLLRYNDKDQKIENPDLRTASKYIKMLVLQEKDKDAISFIKANKKLFETNPVIMNQLYNIYNSSNNIEGCLNIIFNAKKMKIKADRPHDITFLKKLYEKGRVEAEKAKNIRDKVKLNDAISEILRIINGTKGIEH